MGPGSTQRPDKSHATPATVGGTCESACVPTPPVAIHLAQDEAADALLSRSPLALLIGMLLNQRIPKERAFAGPHTLATRLGHEPDAAEIATFDPESFAALFAQSPAIHRFPGSMAGRVQKLAQAVVDDYDGDAEAVWRDARPAPSCSSGWRPFRVSASRPPRPRWVCSERSSGSVRTGGGRPQAPAARRFVRQDTLRRGHPRG